MITPRHPQGGSSPDEDPTGVRALLSSLPEPGPMPPELVDRITASLEREQQERARATAADDSRASVTPLVHRSGPAVSGGAAGGSSRLRRFLVLGSAAAAVVAVAAVGTVVALDQRPDVPAAASVSSAEQHESGGGLSQPQADGALPGTAAPVYFEASGKEYTSDSFVRQAKAMQATNHTPLRSDALRQPQVQQLGPPMDLSQCITTLAAGLQARPDKVWVDLGTYDGSPAVIIVVTTGGQSQAWAVGRTCRAGAPEVLAGPTTLA